MAGESAGCESAADPRLRRDWTALGNHRRRAEVVEIIGPQSARSKKTAAMSDSSGELDLKDDKASHPVINYVGRCATAIVGNINSPTTEPAILCIDAPRIIQVRPIRRRLHPPYRWCRWRHGRGALTNLPA
jgi:hypothetical protein